MASQVLRRHVNSPTLDEQIHAQWIEPGDIFSLLLLVGGDVVQRAIAQQAGDPHLPTPVVFSFGWVAYAFLSLLSAVGDNLLMPSLPDLSCVVISTELGYVRTNQSWVLGRILRDFELSWMTQDARDGLAALLNRRKRPKASLCISVWEPRLGARPKVPKRDWVWWSGYVVLLVQLSLAAVAWGVWGDWPIFAITLGGSVLAFITASLPQWRRERWACRSETKKSFVICRGNGAQHALVIYGNGSGLDLEDLASTGEGSSTEPYTRFTMAALTAAWIVLLIAVIGAKHQTWFLVGIGAIGMMHTVFVAGKSRSPSAFGIHLSYREYILGDNVMASLKQTEGKYPGIGRSLKAVFFPGDLKNQEEVDFWQEMKRTEKERKSAIEGLQVPQTHAPQTALSLQVETKK